MTMQRLLAPAALLTIALAPLHQALAAPVGFTDRAAFEAAVNALNGPTDTRDFDNFADGTVIPSGASLAGIMPVYDFGGVQLEVRAVVDPTTFTTTSLPNYLASDDAGVLQDGDTLDILTLGFVNAIGLRLTSADSMQPNDLVLSANGLDIGLDPAAVQSVLADGAAEYFLGVVDPAMGFSIAQLRTIGGGFFLYAIDDLRTAKAPDSDNDGVADIADNCLFAENAGQLDTDGDNIGNACDADIALPNDCIVNPVDLGVLRAAFFSTPGSPNWNPDADFTGDGAVNSPDLGVMRASFFGPPGPSGLPNPCGVDQSSQSIEGKQYE